MEQAASQIRTLVAAKGSAPKRAMQVFKPPFIKEGYSLTTMDHKEFREAALATIIPALMTPYPASPPNITEYVFIKFFRPLYALPFPGCQFFLLLRFVIHFMNSF